MVCLSDKYNVISAFGRLENGGQDKALAPG